MVLAACLTWNGRLACTLSVSLPFEFDIKRCRNWLRQRKASVELHPFYVDCIRATYKCVHSQTNSKKEASLSNSSIKRKMYPLHLSPIVLIRHPSRWLVSLVNEIYHLRFLPVPYPICTRGHIQILRNRLIN
jgi:hypothetical protein